MKMKRFSRVRRARVPVFVCGTLLVLTSTLQAKDAPEPVVVEIIAPPDTLEFFPSPLSAEFNAPADNSLPPNDLLLGYAALTQPTQPQLAALQDQRDALRYTRNLAALESDYGVLAPELYEPLSSLALLHQKRGEHEEALKLLERAAFIDKANQGLYSSQQIILARQILTSLRALHERDKVRNQLERLVVLNQRHYGREHVETALAMLEFGIWQVDDFLLSLKQGSYAQAPTSLASNDPLNQYERQNNTLDPLFQAQKTFIDAINIFVARQDFANPGLFALENSLIETYYLNARRGLILQNPDYSYQVPKRDPNSLVRQQRMTARAAEYQQGLDSYQRQLAYLKHSPSPTVGQLSRIMLATADWHQLFGKYDAAAQERELLRTLLGKSGLDTAQTDALMHGDSPVLLPTFVHSPLSPRDFAPQDTRGHIDLTLHVDRWGAVSDVETLGMSDDTPDAVVQKLVGLVESSRFRSDAENGDTLGIRYYYRY
jgi:tetratricopeptide (TPR) repeat protein